jgi:hypothetical protein
LVEALKRERFNAATSYKLQVKTKAPRRIRQWGFFLQLEA